MRADFAAGAFTLNVTLSAVTICHCSSALVAGEASIVGSFGVVWAVRFGFEASGTFLHAHKLVEAAIAKTSVRRQQARMPLRVRSNTSSIRVSAVAKKAAGTARETSDPESPRDRLRKLTPVAAECLPQILLHRDGT